MTNREHFILRVESYHGTPYLWGGESYTGIDCNGLMRRCLTPTKKWPFADNVDATANSTMLAFLAQGAEVDEKDLRPGCIFYALHDTGKAFHTGMIWKLTDLSIEAAGGDSEMDTLAEAISKNAFVRIRPHARFKNRRFVDPFWKDGD